MEAERKEEGGKQGWRKTESERGGERNGGIEREREGDRRGDDSSRWLSWKQEGLLHKARQRQSGEEEREKKEGEKESDRERKYRQIGYADRQTVC